MGFLQKKTLVQEEENVNGYMDYAKEMGWDPYTEQQLEAIVAHRDSILEKYRIVDGVSRADVENAPENFKKLTYAQILETLTKMEESAIPVMAGAAWSDHFLVPTAFQKTVVAAEDVFAVGLISDTKHQNILKKETVCVLFTNNPYIPVFSAALPFDEERHDTINFFKEIFENLTYPVQDLNQLETQIKSSNSVNGNISKEFMLDKIHDASMRSGIFNARFMPDKLDPSTAEMLDTYGYIPESMITQVTTSHKIRKIFIKKCLGKTM